MLLEAQAPHGCSHGCSPEEVPNQVPTKHLFEAQAHHGYRLKEPPNEVKQNPNEVKSQFCIFSVPYFSANEQQPCFNILQHTKEHFLF